MQYSTASSDDPDICAVCLERVCNVAAEGLFFFSCTYVYQGLACVDPMDLIICHSLLTMLPLNIHK